MELFASILSWGSRERNGYMVPTGVPVPVFVCLCTLLESSNYRAFSTIINTFLPLFFGVVALTVFQA